MGRVAGHGAEGGPSRGRHAHLAAEAFCDSLLDELCRFTAGRAELALEDDLTLVVVDDRG